MLYWQQILKITEGQGFPVSLYLEAPVTLSGEADQRPAYTQTFRQHKVYVYLMSEQETSINKPSAGHAVAAAVVEYI